MKREFLFEHSITGTLAMIFIPSVEKYRLLTAFDLCSLYLFTTRKLQFGIPEKDCDVDAALLLPRQVRYFIIQPLHQDKPLAKIFKR